MNSVDDLLMEWSYRTRRGYPVWGDVEDMKILDTIISEYPEGTIEKLFEASIKISDYPDFESFVISRYVMEGQEILGLPTLYDRLILTENYPLYELVLKGGHKNLKNTSYTLSENEKELLLLISETIRLTNGEPSELWFAIMYDGKVKGGVAGETGIVSDVDVGTSGVSLKNYARTASKLPSSIDFGTLDLETSKRFVSIIELFKVLSDREITASLTVNSINKMLAYLSDKENAVDINRFIQLAKDRDIIVLRRLGEKIINVMGTDNAMELVSKFIEAVNEMIDAKLTKVDWWAVILQNNIVHLHSSKVLSEMFNSTENQLSSNISNFKGNHLFVSTTAIRGRK